MNYDGPDGSLGCGPRCSCNAAARPHPHRGARTAGQRLAEWYIPDDDGGVSGPGLGWSVRTPGYGVGRLRVLRQPPGHETLTSRAVGPGREVRFTVGGRGIVRRLSPRELGVIIEGNRSVDLGAISGHLKPSEQRKHALRSTYGQPQPAALRDIIGELRAQHARNVAGRSLRGIGMTLHLIQDSYSPAHVERAGSGRGCIQYIRNFGRGRHPREHGMPDPRDLIAHGASGPAVTEAVSASTEYLRIVFKEIHGLRTSDRAAVAEARRDLAAFIRRRLSLCSGP